MEKKSLIAVQGSTQFIAYIAFRWCEGKIWSEESEVTLLVYEPVFLLKMKDYFKIQYKK
jgi:hypothetical protein